MDTIPREIVSIMLEYVVCETLQYYNATSLVCQQWCDLLRKCEQLHKLRDARDTFLRYVRDLMTELPTVCAIYSVDVQTLHVVTDNGSFRTIHILKYGEDVVTMQSMMKSRSTGVTTGNNQVADKIADFNERLFYQFGDYPRFTHIRDGALVWRYPFELVERMYANQV